MDMRLVTRLLRIAHNEKRSDFRLLSRPSIGQTVYIPVIERMENRPEVNDFGRLLKTPFEENRSSGNIKFLRIALTLFLLSSYISAIFAIVASLQMIVSNA